MKYAAPDPQLFEDSLPEPDPVIAKEPVGNIVDVAVGKWGLATAVFDETRTYRYRLSRVWGGGGRVNFLMLNPSTADAFILDPTVRRCVGYAQAWGMGALEVTNAYALRSTDPKGLYAAADPVGAYNDDALVAAAGEADLVVVAWGVYAVYLDRGRHVADLLAERGVVLHALKVTKDGWPGHPLYLSHSATPEPWSPPAG